MPKSPRVTILLPNYNNEPTIRKCIDSALEQTYGSFILLIVDDGSTDKSPEIINSYEDDRIQFITKENNSGIVDTLNIGLDQVNTEFVARLDGDDYMHPERIEQQIQFMDQHKEVDICGTYLINFGMDDSKVDMVRGSDLIKANLIYRHTLAHPTMMFRGKLFTQDKFRYSEKFYLMEDFELIYRMKDQVIMDNVPEYLYYYRITDRNEHKNIVEKKRETYYKLYDFVLSDLKISYPNCGKVHFEIFKDVVLNHDLKTYKHHLDLLLRSNQNEKIFPIQEFGKVISEIRKSLIFRCIDQDKAKFFDLIFKPKYLYYYLRTKFSSK